MLVYNLSLGQGVAQRTMCCALECAIFVWLAFLEYGRMHHCGRLFGEAYQNLFNLRVSGMLFKMMRLGNFSWDKYWGLFDLFLLF